MTPGEPSGSGAERHRILRQLRRQLEQHPAVDHARGQPEGAYAEVTTRLDPDHFGRTADSATLRLVWHPNPDVPDDDRRPDPTDPSVAGPRTTFDAMFKIHYSEDGGYDCGFHNEPSSHVDGWFHFQERADSDAEYDYEPATIDAGSPTAALWELLDLLADRLRSGE
ncbi:hypothetical protein BV210_06180 [Halorientalis sp. IM1011]|uniref:hypothetical protein n=1 Tax=Halorientalis sp. IM1011 TaxID=1932360 RepID=UPI00097CC240|nr:hypothetical protein [Halorientalis sp. IM1011]AQL42323.1 hypothetical protein BV210_06180 [Halorientalis sp. IM1011]